MKITIEKNGRTVIMEAAVELASDVIEELVAPALIAYGWHPESIATAMRDYCEEPLLVDSYDRRQNASEPPTKEDNRIYPNLTPREIWLMRKAWYAAWYIYPKERAEPSMDDWLCGYEDGYMRSDYLAREAPE